MKTLLCVPTQRGNMGLHGLTIEFKTLTSVNFNATCQVSFDCCQGWHDGVPFTAIAISVAQGHETARRLGKRREAAPLCGLVWTPFGISFWSTFPFGIHSTSLGHFDLQPRGRGLTGCYRCEGSHSSHIYVYIYIYSAYIKSIYLSIHPSIHLSLSLSRCPLICIFVSGGIQQFWQHFGPVGSLQNRLREGQDARHVSISQRAAMCILLAISSTDLLEVPTIFGRCFKAM